MAYAVRHSYTSQNPVRDAERPKNQGRIEEKKIRILVPEEINGLLEAETNQKYRTLYMLAIMSGARQGELLGAKWFDIDWEGPPNERKNKRASSGLVNVLVRRLLPLTHLCR